MNKKSFLLAAFCLLLAAHLTGCAKKESEDVYKQEAYPVTVQAVSRENLQEFLFYSGDIEAEDEAVVYSRVSGKLVENKAQEGDFVKKGQTLALVDRDEIGYEFELAPVVSPIEGVVGRVYLDKGANITVSTPIALAVNMDRVRVRINLTEKDLPRLAREQTAQVKVDAYPGEEFTGSVLKVSPVVDLDTRTAPAWIEIDNAQHRLRPGMFARIKLQVGERKDVLLILREAVIQEDSQRYVLVVEGNRVDKRKIKLGLSSDGKFEVLEGLKEGESVVVMGADLKSGDTVRIIEGER